MISEVCDYSCMYSVIPKTTKIRELDVVAIGIKVVP